MSAIRHFGLQRQPAISVDTKKKELIGEYHNQGQEWQRKKEPIPVKMHDFPDKELGKVIPYGIYDINSNLGWVNVGIDHDTAGDRCCFYQAMVAGDGAKDVSRSE